MAALVLNRYHDETAILSLIASGAFALCALRGDTVAIVTDSGAVVDAGSGDVQLFALGLALVSLVTFVGSLRDVTAPAADSLGVGR